MCRRMASIILEREIRQIRIVPQKVYFGADTDRHGIRLDVYAEESREENAKDADLMAIHQMVQKVKHDREVSLEYMKIFERERMIRDDGYTSGKEAELIRIIRRKRGKGTAKEIAEWLELDEVYVQNVLICWRKIRMQTIRRSGRCAGKIEQGLYIDFFYIQPLLIIYTDWTTIPSVYRINRGQYVCPDSFYFL